MGKDGKKGLGMGLGALFGEEYPAPQPEREETAPDLLPIEKIEPRADQPRKRFDPEALEMLAESIRTYGLIQPITVRPLDGGFYQIIAGERRWRASRMAGLKEVPVRILTADEQRAMEMALVENLQREDLNPIEEAKGYRALQDVYGMTQDDVAQSVGKSRPAVANATRLLALSEPVLKLVEDGTLSAGHARALLPLSDPEMQLAAAKTVIEKGLSVRRAEALAAQLLKDTQEKPAKKSRRCGLSRRMRAASRAGTRPQGAHDAGPKDRAHRTGILRRGRPRGAAAGARGHRPQKLIHIE